MRCEWTEDETRRASLYGLCDCCRQPRDVFLVTWTDLTTRRVKTLRDGGCVNLACQPGVLVLG